MRGKLLSATVDAGNNGITPAGAGKTESNNGLATGARDHPRRCGENRIEYDDIENRIGSPPQVRGKLATASSRAFKRGITPAGAGKTKSATYIL